MLNITQLFKGRKKKISALKTYGFKARKGGYYYAESILDGQFEVRVTVADDNVSAEVYDVFAECNYYLHTVEDASGGFVGSVRAEYERILQDISDKCFEKAVPYAGEITRQIMAYAKATYGGKPEYLWEDDDSAIIRRKDNKKWYALFMKIEKSKLGIEGDGKIEILDIRAPKEEIARLVDKKNYFGGWHMNKKSWITVPLDGRVNTEVICWLVDISYELAKGKK
jgi:predicted DNA-binding protein (MmcQ/YjbR family)